eukprot:TRINITY_DN2750_c0_g1_i1.p2 TRINITY_DN2750_c0_g1~~TRINITY_DN2750_c0_g1_i1.p2  ORF type:complete len:339 (+),score=125.84 TRINITY_DN2750_c0_g1_i1:31-1017(+)
MSDNRIKKQIEFYFGDSNYFNDNFLLNQAELNDNWISVNVIADFPRMIELDATIDNIYESCKNSDIVTFNDDHTMMRRINLEKVTKEEIMARSLRLKPIPSTSTIESIEEFMKKIDDSVTVRAVWIRRDHQTGDAVSCFVEFKSVEDAQKILEKKTLTLEEELETTLELKTDYNERKRKENKDRKNKKNKKDDSETSESVKGQAVSFVSGLINRLVGIKEGITPAQLREIFTRYGNIKFVDFSEGSFGGFIRYNMSSPSATASAVIDKDNLKKEIGGDDFDILILDGDEEAEYYKAIVSKSRSRDKGFKKRGGRRNRNKEHAKREPSM